MVVTTGAIDTRMYSSMLELSDVRAGLLVLLQQIVVFHLPQTSSYIKTLNMKDFTFI